MSVRLDAYLDVERTMRTLDDVGDPMAEALRDALDPIWYALSDDERAFLNRRAIAPGPAYAWRSTLDASIFTAVPAPPASSSTPESIAPVRITDWSCAA